MSARTAAFFRCCAALLAAIPALGQQPSPRVAYVYPAGGQQGASFEVTVGGQFLNGVSGVHVSGGGVEAKVLEHVRPMPAAQFQTLRDQVRELTSKKSSGAGGWSAEDEKALADARMKLARAIRRPANAAMGETVRLEMTISRDAAPGQRDLRLVTPTGVTNPLVFCIGLLPEVSKEASRILEDTRGRTPRATPPQPPVKVSLPAVINGQILPGAADRYQFTASKGQRIVLAASARRLIPYISDAVPGWFQAALALYDATGAELKFVDDYRFNPDPVLQYEIPRDGEYTLEIRDAIYRGREDFVYRITAGEVPFIASIFPLGGKAGGSTKVQLTGWNLPTTAVTRKNREAGIQTVSVGKAGQVSNDVLFAVDRLPETVEKEPKNAPKRAQKVKLPSIVNGRIERPGDSDVFAFKGKRGETVAIEVFARRLDSPVDSAVRLTDSKGRQLAMNDDSEDAGAGLTTHHADSRLLATLPASGTYYVHIADAQNKGGAEYGYRLRISRPQPDFELRVAPSEIGIRAGSTAPVTVYAVRKDGFGGDIELALEGAPSGFVLSGGVIPGNADSVRTTLTAPNASTGSPVNLRLKGCAVIEGVNVCRPGVPAEDMMQAFAYHHLVTAREWLVQVNPGPPRAKIAGAANVRVPSGGSAPVRVAAPFGRAASRVHCVLNEPPDGITIEDTGATRGNLNFTVKADPAKVKPGLRGNLIVDIMIDPAEDGGSVRPRAQKRAVRWGTLPAIPFEVVGK